MAIEQPGLPSQLKAASLRLVTRVFARDCTFTQRSRYTERSPVRPTQSSLLAVQTPAGFLPGLLSCAGVVFPSALPVADPVRVASVVRSTNIQSKATDCDAASPASSGQRSPQGSPQTNFKSYLPSPPQTWEQQQRPPPDPSPPPTFGDLQSLQVDLFDSLMGRPSDSVDYMSADMKVC